MPGSLSDSDRPSAPVPHLCRLTVVRLTVCGALVESALPAAATKRGPPVWQPSNCQTVKLSNLEGGYVKERMSWTRTSRPRPDNVADSRRVAAPNDGNIMANLRSECQKQIENGKWRMENYAGVADERKRNRRPGGAECHLVHLAQFHDFHGLMIMPRLAYIGCNRFCNSITRLTFSTNGRAARLRRPSALAYCSFDKGRIIGIVTPLPYWDMVIHAQNRFRQNAACQSHRSQGKTGRAICLSPYQSERK